MKKVMKSVLFPRNRRENQSPPDAQYCLGVMPVAFRNTLMKRLWEQNVRELPMSEQL